MNKVFLAFLTVLGTIQVAISQDYWQQKVAYKMDVELNTNNHQITGHQELLYTNNSPNQINKVYYHLYFNAFQPGSMMDVRSRTISDPDRRVKDRISLLTAEEQGFQDIKKLTLNGEEISFSVEGTILTAILPNAIAPGETVKLDMDFVAQVPQQIRRSGRNNSEGIDYTMTQWYPKMAEYDKDGWHANEYVGREFYGVWGSFDVSITLDSNYVVAGTGVIQNPDEVGHGYSDVSANTPKLTWNFKADNVHDFGWAADPDYEHDIVKVDDSLKLHFFYQTDTLAAQWKDIQSDVVKMFKITNKTFGRYPYSDFSVIQGGDGGMEYPMCTMVVGHGTRHGMVGLITHESIHNWYYGVLGTNEYRYPWMDEGMTTYAEEYAMDKLDSLNGNGFLKHSYDSYRALANKWGHKDEPLATPGDLYNFNRVYSISAYSKGAITQNMLRYIVGDETYYRGVLRYFEEWKFKHPTPSDLLRIMELESDMELDWFFEHWVNTLHRIDYSVNVINKDGKAILNLAREGDFPMPIEVMVTLKSGETQQYYIPLRQMRGEKEFTGQTLTDWAWVNPNYSFDLGVEFSNVLKVEIDPQLMMADINLENNIFPRLPKPQKEDAEPSKKKNKKKKKSKK
ncbi:MAG: M1 family metallopeptidase [Salibacteraceae bacterium]